MFRLRSRAVIAAPAACPRCRCEHSIAGPLVERCAGAATERTGRVRQCVACAHTYAVLDAGTVLAGPVAQPAPSPQAAAPGGHRTGGPGWLDPDMSDPTHDGGPF